MANLYKQLKKYDKTKPREVKEIGGILGLPTSTKTVKVPNQPGYVYVRLRNTNEIVRAYNGKVSPIYDLPVLIAWNNSGYAVLGRDVQRYSNWGSSSSYLPEHGYQHAFTGGDTTWIDGQQFLPLLVSPLETGSTNTVYIFPYLDHKADGTWDAKGGTGTTDLLAYRPTGSYMARALLVYAEANTGVFGILAGNYFDATYTTASQIAPYIPSLTGTSQYPLGIVRLTNTTTLIDWSNVYDARQFFKEGGGTGGGGTTNPPITGSVVISNNAAIQGSALILNFGDSLSTDISGSVAQIDVTSAPIQINTNGIIIWNEGTPLGTGSVLNFVGDNVNVTMSGSVAWINVTGSAGGSLNDYILVRDEKPSGTYSGDSVADTWTIREINTEVSDAGGHASVAANQITLDAGTYIAQITAPFFQVGRVAIRLRNMTDNETTLLGSGGIYDTHCHIVGKFTISAQKVFEVQYICEDAYSEVGLGLPVAEFLTNYIESIEIYTIAEFWKTG
ncbi:MAG: hypothetical protein CO103_01035 [Chloroflexi bacterium CG_4_9_14_3_um_filter_45_9]|nr:MAG: hypothetical protein CO103_01035 [Chloroflexi bacterium CG_4_9_14_3_um_filter_45_9]